jgi:hypothetical protein
MATQPQLYIKPQSDITLTYDADQFQMSLVYKGSGSGKQFLRNTVSMKKNLKPLSQKNQRSFKNF